MFGMVSGHITEEEEEVNVYVQTKSKTNKRLCT